MINKNALKVFLITYFVNLGENLLLLMFFGAKLNMNVFIGAGAFSLIVAFAIDKFVLNGITK